MARSQTAVSSFTATITAPSASPTAGPEPDLAPSIAAEELSEAYANNPVAARKQYYRKWFRIWGTVVEISEGVEIGDTGLRVSAGVQLAPNVACFVGRDIDSLVPLTKGKLATVQGLVQGYKEIDGTKSDLIEIVPCSIVK